MNRESIRSEFKDVIYDPDADPGTVRRQLEPLNREYFTQQLNQRDDFTPDQVTEVADQLEGIRTEVLTAVQTAEPEAQSQDLRSRVENYLRSTGKEELSPEGIQRDFKVLLEDPEASVEALGDRLGQFDRDTLVAVLSSREDISGQMPTGSLIRLKGHVIRHCSRLSTSSRKLNGGSTISSSKRLGK